ncbi:MAG: hypothetical protein HY696_02455 [Deltaproteobacteria bacterium]|nr:hypothetical protein [Deltaproteobacteria bacterium]
MQILFTESFQRDVRQLSANQRQQLFDAILLLPAAFGQPHQHAGLGLRKLHPAASSRPAAAAICG